MRTLCIALKEEEKIRIGFIGIDVYSQHSTHTFEGGNNGTKYTQPLGEPMNTHTYATYERSLNIETVCVWLFGVDKIKKKRRKNETTTTRIPAYIHMLENDKRTIE